MNTIEIYIESESEAMPQTYDLLGVSVVNEVNRISSAELVLIDGSYAKQKYDISDKSFFDPGKNISIWLTGPPEGDKKKKVFSGIVVAQTLNHDEGNSLLTVELSDKAIKLTSNRRTKVFEKKKDSDIIKTFVLRRGLQADIDDTDFVHERIVQYYATDWDLLLSRAEASGLLVANVNGKISAKKPVIETLSKRDFNLAVTDILDLELKLDIREQRSFVRVNTWDESRHETGGPTAKDFRLHQGRLTGEQAGKIMADDGEVIFSVVPSSAGETQAWADAKMMRARLSMLRGSFKIHGAIGLNLLDTISLTGMGKKFEGNTIITGIRQEITREGWFTHLQFGLSADWLAYNARLTDAPAAGLLPGINGLQVGVVYGLEIDDKNNARVKVRLPGVNLGSDEITARMATPDAGNGRGMFFWPEKGDEVILGFINDDPRHAVILGSLYSAKNIPPVRRDDKNMQKGFVSRTKMRLIFDDEKEQLSILTSDKNRVVIDGKKNSIELSNATGNSIRLSDTGIAIDICDNLTITAKGSIDIKGNKVTIQGNTIDFK